MLKFIAGYLYTQLQTTIHRYWVFYYTLKFCFKIKNFNKYKKQLLIRRALVHDLSKYRWKEAKGFAITIFDLKSSTYGSDEYKKLLKILGPSLEHHYKHNTHHPEYYKNGFQDMSDIRKIEMVIDWRSATRRHKDGNIYKSLEINQKRFGYNNKDKEYLIFIAKLII